MNVHPDPNIRPDPNVHAATPYEDAAHFTAFLYGSLGIAIAIYVGVNGVVLRTIAASTLVVLIAVLYWFMGRRALQNRDGRLGFWFLLIAIVLAGLLFQINSVFMTTCFGLYPLCFAMVKRHRTQLIASGLLSVVAALGQASDSHWDRNGWIAGALIGGVSFFFAIVLGRWVASIKDVSEKQEQLIAELTSTRAELSQAQHETGVREERERLSAEIHDTLAQGFSSILMLARTAERSNNLEKVHSLLASISECAQTNLGEARSLVENLAPPALQGASLSNAVARLASKFQTDTGVLTTVATHDVGKTQLSSAEQVVLLRALQESLTNVGRHAKATSVQIVLHLDTTRPAITVVDNGIGFNDVELNEADAGHHGLSGMRNRIAQIGGSMSVSSRPGIGTEVTVTL